MVGKLQDLNQGWPSSQHLMELIDELKQAGYNIGVEQYIAAQDLLLALMAQGKALDQPERLRSLLGPLLCSSPTEQDDFQHRFDQWAERIGLIAGPVKLKDARTEALDQELRTVKQRQRQWWGIVLGVLIALVVGFGFFKLWLSSQPPTPVVTVSPEPATPTPTPKLSEPKPALSPDPALEACPKKLLLQGHTDGVTSVAFSPDGQRIVSGSLDKTLRLWDAQTGQLIGQPLQGHQDAVTSVAFSPDGKRIVSGSWDKTVRLWDATTGALIGQPLRGHTAGVTSVAFSPDGQRIVSGSDDHTLRLWDAKSEKPIGAPLLHKGAVYSVAFSPDGKRIVSSSEYNTLWLWDAQTGQLIGQPLQGHQDAVTSVAFSPDGKRIVSGSWDRTVRLWDATTGALIGQPLQGHTASVYSVAFSPDGKTIVSGSWDHTLRIWDAQTGQPLGQPLQGHTDSVTSVAFSPDGKRLVSVSLDKTLRLWDAQTGQPIGQPLQGHTAKPIDQLFWIFLQNWQSQLGLLLLLPLPLLLAWSGFWFWQAHQFLVRQGTAQSPELERISIAGIDANLFPAVALLRIAQGLRRRIPIPSTDLDIGKTVQETARRVGWLTPVYGYRQVLPEYLVLIDRSSPDDHQARLIEAMLDQLVQNGVFISRYFFKDDPRICFAVVGRGSPCQLQELVARHRQHRLVIFSDAESLLSAQTGELEPWTAVFSAWTDRAVLTPEPPQHWGDQERELARQFLVLPLNSEGLVLFIHSLDLGRSTYVPAGPAKTPLPPALRDRPRRWLEREPPDAGEVDQLLVSLQRYLGPAGYYWFSACAVFPILGWDVTMYLGQALKTEDGQMLLQPQRLFDLVRLPWFRYAYMPDWLRLRLISTLPWPQEQQIRQVLAAWLVTAAQGPVSGAQLEIAREHPQVLSRLVAPLLGRLSHRASPDSPLQDYIFRTFMAGLKPSSLAVRLPSGRAITMPSLRLTRRRLLQLAGWASVGLGGGLLLHRWLRLQQQEYTVVTVDAKGTITQCQQYRNEFQTVDLGAGVSLELMRIPAGTFMMGSPSSELGRSPDEGPQHEVKVPAFWMSKYPVTQAQWRAVAFLPKVEQDLNPNPSKFKGDNHPVENITWYEAIEFCARLSRKTRWECRLPSEAEWEYACRAGTETPFYVGPTITTDLANYNGNEVYGLWPKGIFRKKTTAVGSFPPNAFGLSDMYGNVWEWCLDHWHDNYEGAPTDGSAWIAGGGATFRVMRGGCWYSVPWYCRSAARTGFGPGNRNYAFGFRVVSSSRHSAL